MGCGSYTASDWSRLKETRSIDRSSVNELFKNKTLLDKFNPRFISMRESRDNDEHPNSTPIAIGVDVTGSMGYLSEEIIKNSLNELMKKLYASNVIPDPQLMFAAIGDVVDDAPLQVTQFESDIRIAEQLLELWLEGRGGDGPEDYALFWYFLANHTETDSMKKRNNKGFAFTIGDAPNHPDLKAEDILNVFGDQHKTLTIDDAVAECEEKYNLFHIMIGGTSAVIPGRTIFISRTDLKYLPEIIITAICRCKGLKSSDILGDLDSTVEDIIGKALKNVLF